MIFVDYFLILKYVKLDNKDQLNIVNEICELKSCNNCLFFEMRRKKDCFLWASKTPNGPSAKFHVTNVHTMGELKMTGNCLIGSRPLLMFDSVFEEHPHWKLIKEMFTQIFGTPNSHPNSKPFVDHIICFYILDNHIWFRNYQIVEVADEDKKNKSKTEIVEIGPRFALNLIRIFGGSFGGPTLFQNGDYVSPNEVRTKVKIQQSGKFASRLIAKKALGQKKVDNQMPPDELDDVFTA